MVAEYCCRESFDCYEASLTSPRKRLCLADDGVGAVSASFSSSIPRRAGTAWKNPRFWFRNCGFQVGECGRVP